MQLKNAGRGVTLGQRKGLSFCDELKIRRFYSEERLRSCLTPTLSHTDDDDDDDEYEYEW